MMRSALGKRNDVIYMMGNPRLFADALASLVDHNYFFSFCLGQSRDIHQKFSSDTLFVEDCFAFFRFGILSSGGFSFFAQAVFLLDCFPFGRMIVGSLVFSVILSFSFNTTQTTTPLLESGDGSKLWIHTFGHGNLSPVFSPIRLHTYGTLLFMEICCLGLDTHHSLWYNTPMNIDPHTGKNYGEPPTSTNLRNFAAELDDRDEATQEELDMLRHVADRLDRLEQERDEARRMVCEWHGGLRVQHPQDYAERRGWDCYKNLSENA